MNKQTEKRLTKDELVEECYKELETEQERKHKGKVNDRKESKRI